MQPNTADVGRSLDSPGYELSFPHVRLASEEDELLNRSLLESLSPASPSSSAPYRLPKLSAAGSVSSCTSSTISSRSDGASTSKDGGTPASLSPRSVASKSSRTSSSFSNSTTKLPRSVLSPPYTIAQLRRAQHIHVPTFKRAQFAPLLANPIQTTEITPKSPHNIGNGERRVFLATDESEDLDTRRVRTTEEQADLEERRTRASTRFTHASRSSYGARSAAVSMTIPMASGSVITRPPPDQKPEWRLSPYRHKNYDNQGTSQHFGPYSRSFVIHCSTPKTWLQMKLRRTKTTL